MGWWLDRYLDVVKEVEAAESSLVLATALILDRAGVTPRLAGPIEVLVLGELVLQGDIHETLTALLGPDGFTPYDDGRWKRVGRPQWKPPRGKPGGFDRNRSPRGPRTLRRGVPTFQGAHSSRPSRLFMKGRDWEKRLRKTVRLLFGGHFSEVQMPTACECMSTKGWASMATCGAAGGPSICTSFTKYHRALSKVNSQSGPVAMSPLWVRRQACTQSG